MLLLIFSVMFIFPTFDWKVIANVRWLTTRNFILVINWWTYFDAQIQISGLNRKYIPHVRVVPWQMMVFSQWFKRKTKLFLVTFVKKLFGYMKLYQYNVVLFIHSIVSRYHLSNHNSHELIGTKREHRGKRPEFSSLPSSPISKISMPMSVYGRMYSWIPQKKRQEALRFAES